MFPAETWIQMHEQRLADLRSSASRRDTTAVPRRKAHRLPKIQLFRRVTTSGISA